MCRGCGTKLQRLDEMNTGLGKVFRPSGPSSFEHSEKLLNSRVGRRVGLNAGEIRVHRVPCFG